jgi:hypothetical protein
MNLAGGRALEVEQRIDRLSRDLPWIDVSRMSSPEDIAFAAERIEFFNFEPPAELAGHTSNIWYAVAGGYRLNLPEGESLILESNLLDSWDVRLDHAKGSRLLAQAGSLTRAAGIADSFVSCERPDAVKFVERSASWRAELPTEKQKELLTRKGVPFPQGLTKGQASQMISQVLAASHRRRISG